MNSKESKNLKVICYAGYRGEEEPREFSIEERKIHVVEVLDRWLSPDHRYFKVHGSDGDTYVLRHDFATNVWELTMFAREPKPTGTI